MAPPAGYTASQLTFEDDFDGTVLDDNNWNTFMTSLSADGGPWDSNHVPPGGSSISVPNGGNQDYCMPSQVSVNNGLNLTLERSDAVSGFTAVTGCVTTYGKFQLSSGYVQFLVKMPDMAHGGIPAIWFLPGPGGQGGTDPSRGEIDLFEGGDLPTPLGLPADTPETQVMATHYDAPTDGWSGYGYDTGVNMSAGYHIYGLQYIPGVSIKAYFDGHLVASFTKDINSDPYEIIINNSEVTSIQSSWHTTGTEPYPSVMSIAQVQAYK